MSRSSLPVRLASRTCRLLPIWVLTVAMSLTCAAETSGYGLKLNMARTLDEHTSTSDDEGNTYFLAHRMRATPGEYLSLEGDAEVRRGGSVLKGQTISYTFSSDEIRSSGGALVARRGLIFSGPELTYHIDAETGEMPQAKFRYVPNQMRGKSEKAELLGGGKAQLCNALVTTCREGHEAWWISAEKIDLDEIDRSAIGRNAKLYIGGVPVFMAPYFSFPIGEDRKSGFLTPSLSMSSTNGVSAEIPIYWNIAPNYDYTATLRPMTKRGLLLGNEFRYLQPTFGGQLNYDYLYHDRETKTNRYSLSWRHMQQLGIKDLVFGADYNKVSDNNYITDFSNNIRDSSEDILQQNFWLSYSRPYWSTSLGVYRNQTLRPDDEWNEQPYQKVPEFNLSGYAADYHGLTLSSRLTSTRFERGAFQDSYRDQSGDGWRTMLDTSVALPLQGSFWHFTPKVQYLMTWYSSMKGMQGEALARVGRSESRELPIFTLDSGLVFERNTQILGRSTEQTLEPRLYYAYIPYRDQSNLPNFDSSEAQLSFATLFSPNRYTGYDRISNANQLSAVLTSRFIDSKTGKEWFSIAGGHRYYFDDQRVNLWWDPDYRESARSDILAAMQFSLIENVKVEFTGQYSTTWNRISKTTAGVRYSPREYSVVSLYYRYNYNPNAMGPRDPSRPNYFNDNIKQIDLGFQWPISKDLYALGRYNYSFIDNKVIETLAGMEYRAGCWILRGAVQRYVRSENRTTTNFFIELELVGLGAVGSSPIKALSEGISGYRPVRPRPVEVGRYDYYE